MLKSSKVRAAGALTAVAVAGAATVAVPASDAQKYNTPPSPIKITMTQKGKKFSFKGPSKVEAGAKITFVNKTNPRKGGPHTATVIKNASLAPKGKAEFKACENLRGFCGKIAKAHKVKFSENVRHGRQARRRRRQEGLGQGASARRATPGTTETKGEKHSRKLALKSGSITFFCVVHPKMVKTLKVVK